jgi:hypothetical protein
MFVHGLSSKHILDIFDVCASIVHKNVGIVCDVLCSKNKLFDKYTKTLTENCLLHII